MSELIRINRAARTQFWASTYRAQRRRGRILGWAIGLLFLAGMAIAGLLMDSGFMR
jgi:hypothetical protein